MKPLHYFFTAFAALLLFNKNVQAQTDCNNMGFESNAFTNWQGFTGVCCPGGSVVANTTGIVPGRHTVVSGPGFDPNVPSIPLVSPFGGTYSVKLGNDLVGAEAEKLTYSYTVTPNNTNFTYQYAVILQDPGHAPNEQPRFQVSITNTNGQTVPGGFYNVVAAAGIPNFQDNGAGIVYKNWSKVAVDLTPYIGQTLTISFQTGDCDLAAHFGYAYIDASCIPLEVRCDYCLGDTSADMEAPQGFQYYLWSNGDTTSSSTISQPIPGTTYTVTCKPFHNNNITTLLTYTFPTSLPFDANFKVDASCNSAQATLIDSTTLIQSGTQLTSWQWKVNGTTISTQQQPVYDFTQAGNYNVEVIVEDSRGCADTTARQIVIEEPMSVTPLLSQTEQYNGYGVSCVNRYDGTAEVSVSHAVLPLTFVWDILGSTNAPQVSNLPAGLYDVTVTDDEGCQITTSVQLTSPPAITTAPLMQDILCYGQSTGSIALNASGGAGTLTYTWHHDSQLNTSTITGLSENMYMYTITDANSCSVTGTATVQNTVQDALQVAPSGTEILCAGDSNGAIELFADGGAGSYSYQWSHNSNLTASTATQLSAGLYTVTVTDANNCSATATVQLSAPQAITTNPAVLNALCFGSADGSINLHASGGTGSLTTGWSHNGQLNSDLAQNLSAGTYTVTVSDENSCTISTNITITQPADYSVMSVVAAATTFGTCDGSVSLNLTGGTTPYTYNWSTSPAQTTAAVTQLCAGTYTVTITDANNCTTTATYTIEQPLETGISKLSELSGVSLWPNPYKHLLNLTNVPQGSYDIRIVNAQSSLVYSRQNAAPGTDGTIQLNMQVQPAGVYFITLSSPKATITLQAVRQ